MKIKRKSLILLKVIGIIGLIWLILSIIAQSERKEQSWVIGDSTLNGMALVVYNPDPFYNLDELICKSFARGLEDERWTSQVATVAAAKKIPNENIDLYVFCANTYNWAPDKPIMRYIESLENLVEKDVVAITLGGGSTDRAQRILEETIIKKQAKLIGSKELWLMRPNDELRTKESNIEVAVDIAHGFGQQIAKQLPRK